MKSYFLILLISTVTFAGSRINPGTTEGARPMEYRTGVYLDQNFPLPITQDDLDAAPVGSYSIPTAGWYALSENITGDIDIDADYVKLDFNGYTLTGQLNIKNNYVTVDMQNGIINANKTGILVDTGYHDILIMNGTVDLNTATTGDTDCISIEGTLGYECYNITIQNMFIKDFPTRGINVEYTNDITISRCHVTGTSLLALILRGISCEYVQRGIIEYCSVAQLTNTNTIVTSNTYGIYIYQSNDIYVYACQAVDIRGIFINGMCSTQSNSIIFDRCNIQSIVGNGLSVLGLYVKNSNRNIIQHCIVNTIAGAYTTYGIGLIDTTESVVTNNLVGLVTKGSDIFGIKDSNGTNNVFTQNIAYNNTKNYSGIPNVESGYDGTQPNLNVALPTTP